MSKGTQAALDALHGSLAREMKQRLEDGDEVLVDGQIQNIRANAAFLNVVRQFLRDNGTEVDPDQPTPAIADLGKAMVDLDEERPEFDVTH